MGSPQLQKVSNKRQQQQQQSGAAKPLSTIGNGVEIRSSSLPGAGNGLFADRHFARGDLITEVRLPVASCMYPSTAVM